MNLERFGSKEMPEANVDEIYRLLQAKVNQLTEGWLAEVPLLERDRSGKVVVQCQQVQLGSGETKRLTGLALEQAVNRAMLEDLKVDFRSVKVLPSKRQRQPQGKGVWQVKGEEFETSHPGVVLLVEKRFGEDNRFFRGRRLKVINTQPRPLYRRFIRGFFGQ